VDAESVVVMEGFADFAPTRDARRTAFPHAAEFAWQLGNPPQNR